MSVNFPSSLLQYFRLGRRSQPEFGNQQLLADEDQFRRPCEFVPEAESFLTLVRESNLYIELDLLKIPGSCPQFLPTIRQCLSNSFLLTRHCLPR